MTSSRPDKGKDRWGLNQLLNETLEPGYASARQRAPLPRPLPRWARVLIIGLALAVAGALIAIAYRNTQHTLPDRTKARVALAERIAVLQDDVAALQQQAQQLRGQIGSLQANLLASTEGGGPLLDQVRAAEVAAAYTPVTGPGIVVTLAEPKSKSNDPVGGSQPAAAETIINDRDLQRAVNSLWAVGAEAVAINGRRIGPNTPIRQAGGTVLVDFLPVASPYTIEAIGNAQTLAADFAGSPAGRRFATYRSAYQATFTIEPATKLSLPAAQEPTLEHATVIGG